MGGTEKSRWRGNCNQDVLQEGKKSVFKKRKRNIVNLYVFILMIVSLVLYL